VPPDTVPAPFLVVDQKVLDGAVVAYRTHGVHRAHVADCRAEVHVALSDPAVLVDDDVVVAYSARLLPRLEELTAV
jgi:hypothetical protein